MRCVPGTWARGQHVCWAWLGGTPGCTLTMEGPLPGPWAPRCDGLNTPSFSSTVCRPCGWKSACAALGSTQGRRECCNAPAGPASRGGGAVCVERQCVYVSITRKRAHKRTPLLLEAHRRQV